MFIWANTAAPRDIESKSKQFAQLESSQKEYNLLLLQWNVENTNCCFNQITPMVCAFWACECVRARISFANQKANQILEWPPITRCMTPINGRDCAQGDREKETADICINALNNRRFNMCCSLSCYLVCGAPVLLRIKQALDRTRNWDVVGGSHWKWWLITFFQLEVFIVHENDFRAHKCTEKGDESHTSNVICC